MKLTDELGLKKRNNGWQTNPRCIGNTNVNTHTTTNNNTNRCNRSC